MAHELRFLDRVDRSIWFFGTPRGWVARLFDGTCYRGHLPVTANALHAAAQGSMVIVRDDFHELTIEPEGELLRVIWEPKNGPMVVDLALRLDVDRVAKEISSKTMQEPS